MKKSLRIGTRGSKLALWQASHVKSLLLDEFPKLDIEIVVIKTTGDALSESQLSEIGGKGVFVKEIEEALLSHKIDIAVHSMKDVPTILPEGLEINAVVQRHDPRDALLSNIGQEIADLPDGCRVGTGSLRRASQLLYLRPELEIVPIRGNVDTRIRKLKESGDYDAIILATAGLQRMGLDGEITQIISADLMIPAPGQGIIAIESRSLDSETNGMLTDITHDETMSQAAAERAFLFSLGGDCNVPVGCNAILDGENLKVSGVISSPDGEKLIKNTLIGKRKKAQQLGERLADFILQDGGRKILESLSNS
ncbi:MAG: hydroxymethylbilane synthase [Thermodesulfobacteriota bacterium]